MRKTASMRVALCKVTRKLLYPRIDGPNIEKSTAGTAFDLASKGILRETPSLWSTPRAYSNKGTQVDMSTATQTPSQIPPLKIGTSHACRTRSQILISTQV